MRTLSLKTKTIKFFDSIKSLPAKRYNHYRKCLMMDVGLRTVEQVQQAVYELDLLLTDTESAQKAKRIEENLIFGLYLALTGVNSSQLSFVSLICSIDDKPIGELEDEDSMQLIAELSEDGLTQEMVEEVLEDLKKKINDDLEAYFPEEYANKDLRGLYDMRRLTALKASYYRSRSDQDKQAIRSIQRECLLRNMPPDFNPSSASNVHRAIDRDYQKALYVLEKNGARNSEMTVFDFESKILIVKEEKNSKQIDPDVPVKNL